MRGTLAVLLLLATCLIVALLLIGGAIGSTTATLVFAVALAALGVASRGFRRG